MGAGLAGGVPRPGHCTASRYGPTDRSRMASCRNPPTASGPSPPPTSSPGSAARRRGFPRGGGAPPGGKRSQCRRRPRPGGDRAEDPPPHGGAADRHPDRRRAGLRPDRGLARLRHHPRHRRRLGRMDVVQEHRAERPRPPCATASRSAPPPAGGRAQAVPVESLVAGDVVELAAGALVPADGVILEARAPR